MRITRAKRKPPAFCREVRTGFCGLFGKITAFSAKMILKRTVLWYTFCAKPMILVNRIVALRCRSPCGERGLKCRQPQANRHVVGRSPCGERGLKSCAEERRAENPGRSPCGERGLKCQRRRTWANDAWSLPVRGAWVEIAARQASPRPWRSLPVRGAWVEIMSAGNSGCSKKVAPRAGSVG